MSQCIGRIGGRPGDWYAELDFAAGRAEVIERGNGDVTVCEMPIGVFRDPTDDYDESLVREDEQNRRICKVVFAPEAWDLLKSIRDVLANRRPLADPANNPHYSHELEDAGLLDEIERTLECLNVPSDEPDSTDDLDARTGMTQDERGNIG